MPPKEDYSLKEINPNIDGGRTLTSNMLTLVEQLFFVYIKVVGANNLPANPLTDTREPYAELKIGNYRGRTMWVANTLAPVWNQVFAFEKSSLQDNTFDISVRDRQGAGDEFIGRISVGLGDIPTRLQGDGSLAAQWYGLADQDGVIGSRGDLMLAMWVGNQIDEAYSVAWHADAATVGVEKVPTTRPKVYHSPRLWYLRIKASEAYDLVLSDPNRKPEVYVKARFGNMVLKTKVSKNKSANPTWSEELMFVAAEPFGDPLILTVEDDRGDNGKDILGMYVMPLQKIAKRLLPPPVAEQILNLERHNGLAGEEKKEKFASKLRVTVFLDGVYHVFDEPAHFASDLTAASPKMKPSKIGDLELGILKAEGLVPMKSKNGFKTIDAYCVAKYGSKWLRTSTVVSSLDPKWMKQYQWDVYDPCTVITIGVFDNCNLEDGPEGTTDKVIGRIRIRLSTLTTDRIYKYAYPIIGLNPDGLKKMGALHLTLRFSTSSMVNLLNLYTQPLLPKPQYTSPLSVYQIDSLRKQAVEQVCMRLGRADPPLRREVVEYMLDAYPRVWSIRKGLANYSRVMACLEGLFATWKWFDDIRQWKNSATSILIWALFLFLITFPETILPLFFSYLLSIGARNFFKRPRHPSHLDVKLSQAENTDPDYLDEEFDTFPSSAQGEVLRRRYDRVRSFGQRITTTLGELATQLERFGFLLSWRDPRVTLIFMVLCLVAVVIFYSLPFWWILLCFGTYSMRPPRLRVTLPPIPQNLLRRLPSKEDSML